VSLEAAVDAGTVDQVLQLAHRRPATLGAGRLVCVDGPAGSGKTTLATRLAAASGAAVLHVDDLLEGWAGLPAVHEQVSAVLADLSAGRDAHWRRWDWHAGARAEEHVLAPASLLVLEGVGAGQRAWAALTTVLVWVEAPDDVRLRRGLARDGEALRAHWQDWMAAEAALLAAEDTRARADVVVDTGLDGEEQA
jgi:uridine kinase